MKIGEMKPSDVIQHLDVVAKAYGLRLNRSKDFKFARLVLANLYCHELVCELYEYEDFI